MESWWLDEIEKATDVTVVSTASSASLDVSGDVVLVCVANLADGSVEPGQVQIQDEAVVVFVNKI